MILHRSSRRGYYPSTKRVNCGLLLLALLYLCPTLSWANKMYPVNGLVLKVDKTHRTILVSCQSIPGFMGAMVMPYEVHDPKELNGLVPGTTIGFTLVVDDKSAYAEHIHILGYQDTDQDPLTAQRLKLMNGMYGSKSKQLEIGQHVPDFTLTDQNRQRVTLSQFSGKVVAINFIYTRCPLPNYCFRLSNNFGVMQRRFKARMGKDLIFLTVTFDPVHDTPDTLAHYASIWKADPKTWHFLTGGVPAIKKVCGEFGVDFYPEMGFMYHSLHTAIIDPSGKLVANLEGNQFTPEQLGDLVQRVLDRTHKK